MSTNAPAVANGDNRISAYLQKAGDRLQQALPSHLSAERVVQVVSTMVYRTPRLQECDPASILSATLQAASLGLDLTPGMNEGFLIPRFNKHTRSMECQFQPGYQGLVKLARQSGQVQLIQARIVREKDHFRYAYAPALAFEHAPAFGESGEVVAVYAYARLANGEDLVEVMTVPEIEAVRQRSQSPDSGPWATDWGEMAKKTVLKRLCKALPRSLELSQAIECDNAGYDAGASVVSGPARRAVPSGRGASALAARLSGRQLDAPPEAEFDADAGVARPLRSEADDDAYPDDADAMHAAHPVVMPADDEPADPDRPDAEDGWADPEEQELAAQAARDAGPSARKGGRR